MNQKTANTQKFTNLNKSVNIHSTQNNNQNLGFLIKIFILLDGLIFLLLGYTFRNLPPVIPLYYSLPWGEEQLSKPYEIFIIPLSLSVFFLISLTFSSIFLRKMKFYAKLLLWSTNIIALLGLIAVFRIILLVI